MSTYESKTKEQFPLSSRKVVKKTLAGTLAWIILSFVVWIILSVASAQTSNGGLMLGIVSVVILIQALVIFLLVYLYQSWYYNTYFYDLTDDYIIIKKGPITPQEITIPYERVQDIYVDQDLLDRFFGLYDVHLSSATISSGMAAHIDGVEKVSADGLRATILQTVSQKISKNKTPPAPPAPQVNNL